MGALVVDVGARLVTGLATPYDRSGQSGTLRFQFLPGWLANADARIWLLRDHDQAQRVGRVTHLCELGAGVVAQARIDRGPAGDRALAGAVQGHLGLSPGLARGGTYRREHGVLLVVSAPLLELTLTANPAFGLEDFAWP